MTERMDYKSYDDKFFDNRWLDLHLYNLRIHSSKQCYVVQKTVLAEVSDEEVAKALRVSKQRVASLRRQAFYNLSLLFTEKWPKGLLKKLKERTRECDD